MIIIITIIIHTYILRGVIKSIMMIMMMMMIIIIIIIISLEEMFPKSVIAAINLLVRISYNNPSSLILPVYRTRKFL